MFRRVESIPITVHEIQLDNYLCQANAESKPGMTQCTMQPRYVSGSSQSPIGIVLVTVCFCPGNGIGYEYDGGFASS